MAQIAININENGEGIVFTDRDGTVACEKHCGGSVTFKCPDFKNPKPNTSCCDKCGQTYKVEISG